MIPRKNYFIWIRYLAAFSIVLSHSRLFDTGSERHVEIAANLSWLYPGVPVLFFTSGFLVSLSYRSSSDLIEYIVKRILRIYPAVWVALFASVAVLLLLRVIPMESVSSAEFVLWFVGQMSILFVYHPGFLDDFGLGTLNGSLWAIPVILQFYLLLPLIVRVDRFLAGAGKGGWIYLILLLLAVVNVGSMYLGNFHETVPVKILLNCTVVPWLFIFFLGYCFQRDFERFHFQNPWSAILILGLYLLAFLACIKAGVRWGRNDMNPLLISLLGLLVTNVAFTTAKMPALFDRATRLLEKYDVTFGIFIYHLVVLNFMLHYRIFEGSLALRLSTFFVATSVIAFLSHRFLEAPIRNRRASIIDAIRSRLARFGMTPRRLPT